VAAGEQRMSAAPRLGRLVALGICVLSLWIVAPASPARATLPGANGRLAYTLERDGAWQLFTMRPDGTDIRQLTNFRRPQGTGSPAWSPDGTKIAFDNDRTGDAEVWTINADGSGLERITHDPKTSDGSPAWSPDGSRILFERYSPRTDNTAIFAINADGTGMSRLTGARVTHERPRFTPDGSKVVYTALGASGGICEIWSMNPDGTGKELLMPADARLEINDVAPNGDEVLVNDNCVGPLGQSLYRVRIDGTGLTRLTDAGCCDQDGFAAYSPDGTKIVFVSDRIIAGFSDFKAIYEMDSDGEHLTQITSVARFGGLDWGPAIP
jgi:Tol biopolymer transport system component